MKTIHNVIQLGLLAAVLALPMAVRAQLSYSVNGDGVTATITGYNTAAGPFVIIPATINGYPVTSIGNGAFLYSGIQSVTIGTNVTSIGMDAFYYCNLLSNVTIPNSVTSIGGGLHILQIAPRFPVAPI